MDCQLIVSLKRQKSFYESQVKVLSPAKLNLYLNVLGKFPSTSKFFGYHKIETIFERISLFDEITIKTDRKPSVKLHSNVRQLMTEKNLCIQAVNILKKRYKLKCGFSIYLKKNIPIGAGLGGGSSNAASTLIAINELLKFNLSQKELFSMGELLGSDVNFFLAQTSYAVGYNRGEKIKPFKGNTLKHFLVWPSVSLSTSLVYKSLNVKLTKFVSNVNILKYAIKKLDYQLLKKNIYNALEKTALDLCKQMKDIKDHLTKKKIDVFMSGAGTTLYGILKSKEEFKAIVSNLSSFKCKIFYAETF